MTWIFGCATQFVGTAVVVADIQVTAGDRTFDGLKKLYVLDNNFVAGFAGNVEVGFTMLDLLAGQLSELRNHDGSPTDPSIVMSRFSEIARSQFAELDPEVRATGCEILIAGAAMDERAMYASQPIVARFGGPDFAPEVANRGEWISIGSGNHIEEYRLELEKLTGDSPNPLLALEANNPGGYASIMSFMIVEAITELPSVPGISEHFHICVLSAHGFRCQTSDKTVFPGTGPPEEKRMPEVAQNWAELQELAGRKLGLAPRMATA